MSGASAAAAAADSLVMYIVVRGDLGAAYSTGALIAQGAHAATAALWASRDAPATQAYCGGGGALESMHKVVLRGDGAALEAAAAALRAHGAPFHVWLERPENVATALATAPGSRAELKPFFAAFKLFR